VIKVDARGLFSIAARRLVPGAAVVIRAVRFCGVFFEVVTDEIGGSVQSGQEVCYVEIGSRKGANVAKTQKRCAL